MSVHVVLCFGDPSHLTTFHAYARKGRISEPAPRGEVLLCPVGDDLFTPAVVTDTRIGGGASVLVLYAGPTVEASIAQEFDADSDWQPVILATGIKGDVIGIFVDDVEDDIFMIDAWPAWTVDETHLMVSLGLVPYLPRVEPIDSPRPAINTGQFPLASPDSFAPSPPTPAQIVDMSAWKANKRL